MSDIKKKLEYWIMVTSFREQRKRKLAQYMQETAELAKLGVDELGFEYITAKSDYEHKKQAMSVYMIAIILSIVMGVWSALFSLILKITQYVMGFDLSTVQPGDVLIHYSEIAEITITCFSVLAVLASVVLITFIVMPVKRRRKLYRRLLLIEEVRKNSKARKELDYESN